MTGRRVLGSLFLAPAILYILVLVGFPFLLAIYYSVSAYTIYNPSYHFVGLANFRTIVQSYSLSPSAANTFIFTIGSQILGLDPRQVRRAVAAAPIPRTQDRPGADRAAVGGADGARHRRLGVDVQFALQRDQLDDDRARAGDPGNRAALARRSDLAMLCVIIVNAWRFFPFAIVIFLAGITAVPQDVLDAATVDGAGFWRRNYQGSSCRSSRRSSSSV